MNSTSIKIIKSVFLSAVLSLVHSNAKASNEESSIVDLTYEKDNKSLISKQHIFKNILKIGTAGKVSFVRNHRSHCSHSSHGSHYSSSSNTIISDFSDRSNQSIANRGSDNAVSQDSTTQKPATSSWQNRSKTPATYSLGDRSLFLNLYGKDVDELVTFLITNKFLSQDHSNKKNGYCLYDQEVKSAVELFQRQAHLNRIDGRFGEEEKQAYDNWGRP